MNTIAKIMALADYYAEEYSSAMSDSLKQTVIYAREALHTAVTELASTATEYQQAADKMAMDHKVVRDRWIPMFDALQAESHTLRQQLAEAQALIEASRNQEPVAWMLEGGRAFETVEADYHNGDEWMPLYAAAPVVAPDVPTDAERLNGLEELCGCWQDGTDKTLKLFQDDATKTWILKINDDCYYGDTFNKVIDAAIGGAND